MVTTQSNFIREHREEEERMKICWTQLRFVISFVSVHTFIPKWIYSVGCIAISPHRITTNPSLPIQWELFSFVSYFILLYFILCLIIFHSVSVVFMFIFRLLLIISIVSSIIDRIIIVTQRNEKTFHLAIDSLLCRFQSTKIPLLCCAVCTYLYRFSIYSDAQFYRHFPCSILSVHNFC